jgi:hypothetical protein
MDHERYPNYFLVVSVLYGLAFIMWFSSFFVPSLYMALQYPDFIVMSILFFLPMVLLALYSRISMFRFLWGKENYFRMAISALTIVDFIFVTYLMILLM